MTLETQLNELLEQLLTAQAAGTVSKEQLIHTLDLTLLEPDATTESLALLGDRANTHHVAAVCVLPEHLSHFHLPSSLNLATVINFPHRNDELLISLAGIDNAIQLGANEIDFVLPYQAYLTGNSQKVLNHCDVIIQACKKHEVTIKIILETGAFPDMEHIYNVSKELITMGTDFIKTSTGTISQGATLPAVFSILSALKETEETSCGIKISGGVKTTQQALNYACLAELMLGKTISNNWFRIGASSLLNDLLNGA
ncbi:deoxyribose-phosphate aldolase [Legionella bononiensis]|uniref:Deoxyribose-phosphate aldolase n=1 Tax=Legionella bononiensis TaxID=2793102 RepID=A0ABS1W7K2_9GAMM|nr:deoxyribose-phosphate aldolase [Legionella bononiensis]MBL7525342.1 deoxyribose-phosphate aldolase [Legionella bononiensis]MBL7561526.1 deoxyribose-phosphate aldolase [Legionella bononiensis]